ncbi:LysR substrate-binding domain-containing protein [Thalassospira xianhensis]|uniref:LysR family transcriptional regulator n=1 Tax=Thalassospira xianhensis MCCC 1A02616 TaxID=1177929 RepID=A0A367UDI1_9PROT|nr:LysR substrate-binding domain-containing protein [Thalassospira xianhensis]RCK06209.1 LysR family transcriptional regulator [Thalassospira xianhensis MCCC 1A02616]UKV14720.1 LysR family transcriptional regulator [Thalassospiraceae bacterium SW-3-3]
MATRHTRIVERALTRLKLRQLRLLIAVAQHGSIQNAARDLSISQPAATKMIQDLELDFEVKLFERTNRGVVPTVFGESLIRHGKLIFAQVSNAAQELDDLNEGNSGRVVVGTLLAASPTLLPIAVEELLKARPNVAIKIVEGTNEVLMPGLLSGEIDMVVGRLPSHRYRENITQEKFFDERVLAVTGMQHPLAAMTNVSFDQLKPFGWILPPVETTLRRQTDQFFIRQDQYVPPTAIESVSYLANRSLLRTHNFIGIMPAHVAALDIQTGVLASVDWVAPFGAGPVGVSYRGKQSLSPAGSAFLSALRSAAAEITASQRAI